MARVAIAWRLAVGILRSVINLFSASAGLAGNAQHLVVFIDRGPTYWVEGSLPLTLPCSSMQGRLKGEARWPWKQRRPDEQVQESVPKAAKGEANRHGLGREGG